MKTDNPNMFCFNLRRYPSLGLKFREKCFRKNKNMIDVIVDLMEKWINEPEPPKKPFIDLFEAERNKINAIQESKRQSKLDEKAQGETRVS